MLNGWWHFPLFQNRAVSFLLTLFSAFISYYALERYCSNAVIWFVCFCFIKFTWNSCCSVFLHVHAKDLVITQFEKFLRQGQADFAHKELFYASISQDWIDYIHNLNMNWSETMLLITACFMEITKSIYSSDWYSTKWLWHNNDIPRIITAILSAKD